jgi:hypothetical protein
MPDEPDFSPRRGVDILSQSVGELAVELATETIGSLAVDIASQSVGDVDINVNGQTGSLDVTLSGSNTTLDVNLDSQSTTVDTNIQSQTGDVGIDIQSQTISDLGIDIQSQSLSEVGTQQDQNPSETVNLVQIVRDTTVGTTGSGDSVFLTPPPDEVWELQAIRLEGNQVSGASSGDHGFSVFALDGQIGLTSGFSNPGDEVTWNRGYWEQATSTQDPPTPAAQVEAIKGVRVGPNTPIEVTYLNRTNSSTSATRTIRALFRAIKTT